MNDEWLVIGLAALLGAILGSFLNVCIVRLPANQSVVRPRSRCPRCERPIAWYDNIPIVSWLVLRGRCRDCDEPISVLYPAVELLTALIWAGMAWRHPWELEAVRGAIFFTLLLGIALTDAREYIIPDEFTWGGLVLGIVLSLPGGMGIGPIQALIGAVVGFGLLWLVGFVGTLALKEEAMGGGDIKMMAMVGAFVGWPGVLLTIFLGALLGTMIFLPLTLLGRKKQVPFGVFLSIGGAAAWLVGPAIITWYRHYLGF